MNKKIGHHSNFQHCLSILSIMSFRSFFAIALLMYTVLFAGFSAYAKAKPPVSEAHTKKLENIRLVLKFGTAEKVVKVLGGFKLLKPKEQALYIKQLDDLLASSNALIKRKVIETIGNMKAKDLDNKLPPYLEDSSNDIFFTAVRSIDKKKIQAAVPVITKLMKEIDFTRSNYRIPDMLIALVSLEDQSLSNFLFSKLLSNKTNAELRRRIMIHLAHINYKTKSMIDFLKKIIEDEEEKIKLRETAIYSLGKMKITSVGSFLRDEFEKIEKLIHIDEKRKFRGIRRNIIYALVQLKDKLATKILFIMARDDDETIRLKMIEYIKEIDSPKLWELLEYQSKYDPNPKVQRAAKKVLTENKMKEKK